MCTYITYLFDAENHTAPELKGPDGEDPLNCVQVKQILDERGGTRSPTGVYTIYVDDRHIPVVVSCDLETAGGGWTVCINLHHICSVLS